VFASVELIQKPKGSKGDSRIRFLYGFALHCTATPLKWRPEEMVHSSSIETNMATVSRLVT
jgi:hypothetical protein